MSIHIVPLGLGTIPNSPLAALTHGHGWSQTVTGAMVSFLVLGAGDPIIVDTGPLDPGFTKQHHHMEIVRSSRQALDAHLGAYDLEPADIRIVVNTHLHWDHSSNNPLFTNATFVVQHDELAYAVDPLPIHRLQYEKVAGLKPRWMDAWDRIESVRGDVEIAPGVRCIWLPGHTPGSQGVLVETAQGPHLIAGDTVDLYANWEGSPQLRHIPSSIHTDLFQYQESFDRIDELDCVVIPSHDVAVHDHGPFGHDATAEREPA